MAMSIGDTTVGNSARAATGIFNGPVILGDTYGDGQVPDKTARHCRNAIFLTDPAIDRATLIYSKGNRAQGTCEWIMRNDTFKAWRQGKPTLLWIRGGPGKGKTMMSVYITQELPHEQQQETIYYFCIGQDEIRNSATAVLRGLIWQILQLYPDLTTHILPWFVPSERGLATLESEETLWHLFKTIAGQVTCSALYCVIDGMDECDEDSLHWLASKLLEAVNNPDFGSLRLLVLSRDIPPFGEGITRIELEPDHRGQVSADVEIFVRSQVDQLSQRLRFSSDFHEFVVRALLDRCEGTFLWVGFVMRELSRKRTKSQVQQAIRQLPKGLPAFYSRMLSQIDSFSRHKSIRLFIWLSMSFKPLSFRAYADTLECEATDLLTLEEATCDQIAICAPMVVVEGHEIKFVHQSAKDYLLRPEPDEDPILNLFRIDPPTAHLIMAQKCLQALACGTWLQYYSLTNWPKHAQRCPTDELFESEQWFFTEASNTRDSWWRKYSMNFRGIPQEAPPRLHVACYLGLGSWVRAIMANLQGSTESLDALLDAPCSTGWLPLDYAAEGGHEDIVKLLFERSSGMEHTQRMGQGALARAVMSEREISVRLLLQHGFDPGFQDIEERSLFHHAVILRNWTIVDLLLGHGANASVSCHQAVQPLHEAYSSGREALLRRMLEAGADPNSRNRNGDMLIHIAITGNLPRVRTVRLLLQHGCDIDAKDGNGNSALHILLTTSLRPLLPNMDLEEEKREIPHPIYGRTRPFGLSMSAAEMFRLLLDRHANTKVVNIRADTVLHVACSKGLLDAITILMQYAVDLDARDAEGRTALAVAIDHGHNQIAELLLSSGADPNVPDHEETSPLHRAAEYDKEAAVRLLIGKTDLNSADARGRTALIIGLSHGCQWVAILLLAAGADPSICDHEGTSPLHLAAQYDMYDVAKRLIGKMDLNLRDARGRTALYIAAEAGHYTLARLLVRFGADPNSCDVMGRSALHAVAKVGFALLAQDLIKSGTRIETEDSEGNTALHVAAEACSREIVEVLIRSGTNTLIHSQNAYGQTALHLAAEADCEWDKSNRIMERLCLKNNQDTVRAALLNVQDAFGDTALHYATRKGRFTVVECLLILGADVKRSNVFGQTALQLTFTKSLVANGPDNRMSRWLLFDYGAKRNPADLPEIPSCEAASQEELDLIVNFWREQENEEAPPSSKVPTALYSAVSRRSLVVVKKLLQSGADPNIACFDEQTLTPLIRAVAGWHDEIVAGGSQADIQVWRVIVTVLLRYRADVNWDSLYARTSTALLKTLIGGSELYAEVKKLILACDLPKPGCLAAIRWLTTQLAAHPTS